MEQTPTPQDWEAERQQLRAELGLRMRGLRQAAGLTLEQAAQRTGLALSTIHKIEAGRVSPSYENLLRVARGYQVGIEQLFGSPPAQTTRLAITKAGQGARLDAEHIGYEMLGNTLSAKKIIPLLATVAPRAPLRPEELAAHAGEELVYVLAGAVELTVEHYQPVTLTLGDCAYFDSTLKHGLRALGDAPAKLFWASTCNDHADGGQDD